MATEGKAPQMNDVLLQENKKYLWSSKDHRPMGFDPEANYISFIFCSLECPLLYLNYQLR